MAKDRKRYPLIKKAWSKTNEVHPNLTTRQAYYAGAELIIATMAVMVNNHPEILDTLLPNALESLHIETGTFLKEEELHDTLIA